MTNFKNLEDKPETSQNEAVLDSLFKYASTRPKAPREDEEVIRATTYAEWQKLTGRRKQKRYLAALGLAASLVLTVILVASQQNPAPTVIDPGPLAKLEVQSGEIFVHNIWDDNSTAHRLAGSELYPGQVITTNSGARLALHWQTGESIRLDENSKLVLLSVSEIELISGRIYVDTRRSMQTGPTFVIKTVAGPIRHMGTQYLAGIEDETVSLAVREGEVLLGSENADIVVHRGELVSIGPAGNTEVRTVQTFDDMWAWTNLVTPELTLDGLSAFEFIQWAGRETGREVEYLDAATKKLSMEIVLRGRVNLKPDRALELILQTSDIEAVSSEGKILIRHRAKS